MSERADQTRAALVSAALETVQAEGFARTTARAIAQRAGVNQALVFYHYGGVNDLLLAALERSSAERLAAYRSALADVESLDQAAARAAELYREDVAGGHVTVLAELVGASLAHPELAPQLVQRMEPWFAFTRETLGRLLGGTALETLVPVRETSFVVVALYLGLNLLSRLDPEGAESQQLFDALTRAAPLFS
jgi:AcrR family transcriptional regulator